jgi:hypothetical protein
MDIRNMLLAGHSKRQTLKIAAYAASHSKRFAKLMGLFLGNDYKVTQRAGWALTWAVHSEPRLLKPWTGKLVKGLGREGLHPAVKRNTLRVLCEVSIPKKYQGLVFTRCLGYMSSGSEPIAVRVFAMSVLGNICRQEPELKREVVMAIEGIMPYSSPAIRSRARKILEELA